ncbi:PRAME family member 12-like [Nannospalax galili]|uniref:PRAME family member 12-like n=1 Tax=Nannospalax galili TaxID=1026970 RepID=UPI0004ED468D|nr:PRAME family member 12-like [Nannospalax galili]
MSFQAPPTLVEVAKQCLLGDEAVAISALQYLPKRFIPPLFMEAFTGRRLKVLREMVAAWPYPCLPVGALMEKPHLETLKAVLDGVDKLLRHKVHPRSWKLQVLDLRTVQHSFWNTWAGMEDAGSSAQAVSDKQIVKDLPRYALRRRLKVFTDLSLRIHLSEYQTYLLQWAEQRKSSLKLCCPKMQICALPVDRILKVLTIIQPEFIEELELFSGWSPSTLEQVSPYLGQMRNLHKLFLARIHKYNFSVENTSADPEEMCVSKFISQFSKFDSLQHLYLNGLFFLSDHMKQLFSCLKTPLETLSISRCLFSQCDLNSLCQCQSLRQLKHLSVRGVEFFDLCLMDMRVFLERVADTLQTLELEHCGMQDSQLSAFLPALSQCSQLTKVNFYDNDISMAILRDLLHHTANLSQLTLELYPAPLECFDDVGDILPERFAQICLQLMDALIAIRQPKTVSFATNMCLECCSRSVYDLETTLCRCWQ